MQELLQAVSQDFVALSHSGAQDPPQANALHNIRVLYISMVLSIFFLGLSSTSLAIQNSIKMRHGLRGSKL